MSMSITINGFPVETTHFPNGEVGFQEYGREANVIWRYDGDHELLHLKMLMDHLDSGSNLVIEYLPYSRMDRVKGQWVFTLRTVCDLINSMGFKHIWVAEPHSDVCMGLLRNSTAYYPTWLYHTRVMDQIGFEKGLDYLIYPDQGAEKRYDGYYKGHKTMTGFKKRDFETGKITSFHMVDSLADGPMDTIGRKAIIIDDLCSYGGTFMATAERLVTSYGIEDITLLVAHLEMSVFEGKMLRDDSPVTRVYATESLLREHGKFPGGHKKITPFGVAWPYESPSWYRG